MITNINKNGDYAYKAKVVIDGDCGVGKSDLLYRIVKNELCPESRKNNYEDFGFRDVQVEGKTIRAFLYKHWGMETFRALNETRYCNSYGALLVYDISRYSTFKGIDNVWLEKVKRFNKPDIVLMLVGNKSDLHNQREVTTEEAKIYAEKNNMLFIEMSTLDSTNVETAVRMLFTEIDKMVSKREATEHINRVNSDPRRKCIIL